MPGTPTAVPAPPPDLVFVVRRGEPNDGLRYVLRSMVANVPHTTVWIAGYTPRWMTGVRSVPVRQDGSKWANSTGNLRAALAHPQVADRLVFCCDDTFVLAPVDEIPVMHRGTVASVVAEYKARRPATGQYIAGMEATARFLQRLGVSDPLSYEVHAPLPVDKRRMAEALELPVRHGAHLPVLHKRTLYGGWAGIGGVQVTDPKLTDRTATTWPAEWRFLSTSAGMMAPGHPIGDRIRGLFPDPSPYELPPGTTRTRNRPARALGSAGRLVEAEG